MEETNAKAVSNLLSGPCPEIVSAEYNSSVAVVSSTSAVAALTEYACLLGLPARTTYTPQFFAASIDQRSWIPRVCVVKRNNATVGILYARERKIAGFRTGLLTCDAVLGDHLSCHPDEREFVLSMALLELLAMKGTRGIRVLLAADGYEQSALGKVAASNSLDFALFPCPRRPIEQHSVLPLGSDWSTFLQGLGRQTRRNFRYYRRAAEERGCVFISHMDAEPFARAARELVGRCRVGTNIGKLERALAVMSTVPNPFRMGLCSRSGELLSVLCGWYEGDCAVLFTQLNDDKEHPSDSLSVVMRSYAIEALIERGVRKLVFWRGVSEPLSRYARVVPSVTAYLDKPSLVWRTFRTIFSVTAAVAGPRFSLAAKWVSGPAARFGR